MRDARLAAVAGRQHNRIALEQLVALGLSRHAIAHRVETGRLVHVHDGVFAVAPVLDDPRGGWMAATLTAPGTELSHASAAVAWGVRGRRPGEARIETVTRPGRGGPRRQDGVLVHRSRTLDGNTTTHLGIPITTVERTLVDLAPHLADRTLAKAVREAIRLRLTDADSLRTVLERHRGRRGVARLRVVVAGLAGLALERTRSDAEARALEVLARAGRRLPEVNRVIAGQEADLSWPGERLIVEVDGRQFHLDAAEDARRQAVWERAGWTVHRLLADAVFDAPEQLLALTPPPNVPERTAQAALRDARADGVAWRATWNAPSSWSSPTPSPAT